MKITALSNALLYIFCYTGLIVWTLGGLYLSFTVIWWLICQCYKWFGTYGKLMDAVWNRNFYKKFKEENG